MNARDIRDVHAAAPPEPASSVVRRPLPSPCVVRLGKPDDLAWVVDCWTKHAPALRDLRLREATRHVRILLARPSSVLRVAHVPDEPDSLLGWAALENGVRGQVMPCLHYVYVRSVGRKQGIASALLRDVLRMPIDFSHVAPRGVAAPATWNLNLKRAETE